jgi:thiamine kinase-like enzyme
MRASGSTATSTCSRSSAGTEPPRRSTASRSRPGTTKLWLIDYEYAGNNDPCFELGNIWAECQLSGEALTELVTEYYGRPRASKVARAMLLGLAGKYGWTLWGAIQAAVSPIDFDFWSWGLERFGGAVAGFRDPGFDRLLDDVQRDD